MYRGDNVTAIQSQIWLSESLIELLKVKPYKQISIKDISEKALLSRQTFYNLFSSKEEVLSFHLERTYQEYFLSYQNEEILLAEEAVSSFMGVIEKTGDLLRLMVKNNLFAILSEEIIKAVGLFAECFVDEGKKDKLFPYSKALLSGAFSQALILHLTNENPISSWEFASLLTSFLKGELYLFPKS